MIQRQTITFEIIHKQWAVFCRLSKQIEHERHSKVYACSRESERKLTGMSWRKFLHHVSK